MLKSALTTVKTYRGRAAQWRFGVCEMQGQRSSMEDTHLIAEVSNSAALFGVFDGHNGVHVADFLKANFLSLFLSSEAYCRKDYSTALQTTLLSANAILRFFPQDLRYTGATCVLIYISNNTVHIANLGLCKALVAKAMRGKILTTEHRADLPEERGRIERCGGFVCGVTKRVNRMQYEFSRSIGDFAFKSASDPNSPDQLLSPVAHVSTYDLCYLDDFLVLGSHGFWEARHPQEIVLGVHKSLRGTQDLAKGAESLCTRFTRTITEREYMHLPETAGTENMCCVLVTRC